MTSFEVKGRGHEVWGVETIDSLQYGSGTCTKNWWYPNSPKQKKGGWIQHWEQDEKFVKHCWQQGKKSIVSRLILLTFV